MDRVGLERRLRTTVADEVGLDAARVPCTRWTPRTTAECRSAWSLLAPSTTFWPRSPEFGAPVVPRGGGTSRAGNSTGGGLVLDMTRLDRSPVLGARAAERLLVRTSDDDPLAELFDQLCPAA